MTRKLPPETVATFLGQTPLFKGCPAEDLIELASSGEYQRFPEGTTILQAGKPAMTLGVMLKGRARMVLVDAMSGNQTRLDQIGPGDPFGELGFLLGGTNPAAVVAEDVCDALLLAKQQVDATLQRNAPLCLVLAKRLASRLVQVSLLGPRNAPPAAAAAPAPAEVPAPSKEPAAALDRANQIPWVEVADYRLGPELLAMFPAPLIQKHRILPLQLQGSTLTVGMVNPRSIDALQELRRVLHTVDPKPVAISFDDFNQTFVRLKLDTGPKPQASSGSRKQAVTYLAEQEKEAEKSQLIIGNEVIGLFDRILGEAVDLGASDIHIEPDSTGVRVRYRVHGGLIDRQEFLSAAYAAPLVARIKVLSELDITERRQPQDGRIAAQYGRRELNLRVSTIPVSRGEKAVIRIIDPGDVMRPLHQIFVIPELERAARSALAEPYGCILVAGPTGSGKSSTLYSMLNERKLARPDTGMVTVEDPVEFQMQGLTQVPVLPRTGFGFSQALRGLMRQDPDVIMVGELRDSETTAIALEASLTGHLVLTSIHGNNAMAVIQRLQYLGSDPVLLSQAMSLIVVQRLAKRLCPSCAVEAEVAPALLENLISRRVLSSSRGIKLPRPVGCDACHKTGYLGRVAVHEILQLDDEIRGALASGLKPAELLELALKRKKLLTFASSAAQLIARRLLAPSDALLMVAD